MQTRRRSSHGDQITSILNTQQQLLEVVLTLDRKLNSIGEVVGATVCEANEREQDLAGIDDDRESRLSTKSVKFVWADSHSDKSGDMSSLGNSNPAGQTATLRMRARASATTTQPVLPMKFKSRAITGLSVPSEYDRVVSKPTYRNFWNLEAWNPDSRSRMLFDLVSVPLLLYDAFVVPYLLAWDVPLSGMIIEVPTWITRLFWTIDLFVNLVTGYRGKNAKLVLLLRPALGHYLSKWFLPDLMMVVLDWLCVLLHGGSVLRWANIMRLVRSSRIFVRGWPLTFKAKLMIPSKIFHLVLELLTLILTIIWVNHIVCCGWYSMGGMASDTGETWRTSEEYDRSDDYAYWTALHWAMTQMTPGSMEVVPKSSGERIYNISILMLGLLMGTSLVAMMTSMLTQYKLTVETTSKKFMILHKFLNQQGVEPDLALAIKMHVKARSAEGQRLRAQDVEYLSLLSNAMQDRLWCSWCKQHINQHQLFSSLLLVEDLGMRQMCKEAMHTQDYGAGDVIFEEGALGEDMYFLASGQLVYRRGEADNSSSFLMDGGDGRTILHPGSWCSEAALWTHWVHLGTLEASHSAEVLLLSAPRFMTALASYPVANEVVADYATAFHQHICDPGVVKTDLSHVVDNCELLSSLSPETRYALAEPIMEHIDRSQLQSFLIGRANLELLKREVSAGKSDVRLIDGEVVRTTSIVAVRLHQNAPKRAHMMSKRRSDTPCNKFLVRIGEQNRQTREITECVLLPGVKRGWRESYLSCCDRILDEELEELKGVVDFCFDGNGKTVFLKQSSTYGIRTRYVRTTFDATLTSATQLRSIATSAQPLMARMNSLSIGSNWFSLESFGLRAQTKQHDVINILSAQASVLLLRSRKGNSTDNLYLWLTDHEFSVLSTDAAKPFVKQWLNNLNRRCSSKLNSQLNELRPGDNAKSRSGSSIKDTTEAEERAGEEQQELQQQEDVNDNDNEEDNWEGNEQEKGEDRDREECEEEEEDNMSTRSGPANEHDEEYVLSDGNVSTTGAGDCRFSHFSQHSSADVEALYDEPHLRHDDDRHTRHVRHVRVESFNCQL